MKTIVLSQASAEATNLGLKDLCQRCGVPADFVFKLMDYGIIDPVDDRSLSRDNIQNWEFEAPALFRIQRVLRLQQDLHVNLAGAALALDLMDQIDELHQEVSSLHSLVEKLMEN